MRIGDRVVLLERVELFHKTYEIGHEFTIVADDDIRGFDLKDDDGNELGETRFVKMRKVTTAEDRERKLNKILNEKDTSI